MMKLIKNPTPQGIETFLAQRNQGTNKEINKQVENIVKDVRNFKDEALFKYSTLFDQVTLSAFKVSDEEIKQAFNQVDDALYNTLKLAVKNITEYHEKQGYTSFEYTREDGTVLGQKVSAIESVGIYVPGGTASYPSTVLMNAIPAKIAQVKKIVMITPPNKDGSIKPSILVAASLSGVDEIYKVGGAHGIASLAYGTESIPKVDKIVGPGNIYVSTAKKQVFGDVGIDMIAGPSEILIIAEEDNNPKFIAADLFAQAEHDTLASSILITPSLALALEVKDEIEKSISTYERHEIIAQSLFEFGLIIVVDTIEEAIRLSNHVAPEHLELLTKDPFALLPLIQNAGSIFLGPYTPEAVGDYLGGPNHTLPTSQTARFSSPLSTADFQKKSSYIYTPQSVLKKYQTPIADFANEEGLTAHARSVTIRFKEESHEN